MSLIRDRIKMLNEIVQLVGKIRAEARRHSVKGARSGRQRRTGAEAEKMRREVLIARAEGMSAAKLAEKYGVSSSYIYMIKK
jgi:Mor family transcriptional regulator